MLCILLIFFIFLADIVFKIPDYLFSVKDVLISKTGFWVYSIQYI